MNPRRRRELIPLLGVVPLVLLLLAAHAAELSRFSHRQVGLFLSDEDGVLKITEVMPDEPAEAAGLHTGDRVVALAGCPRPAPRISPRRCTVGALASR